MEEKKNPDVIIEEQDVYIAFIKEICNFLEINIFYISKELETNFCKYFTTIWIKKITK